MRHPIRNYSIHRLSRLMQLTSRESRGWTRIERRAPIHPQKISLPFGEISFLPASIRVNLRDPRATELSGIGSVSIHLRPQFPVRLD